MDHLRLLGGPHVEYRNNDSFGRFVDTGLGGGDIVVMTTKETPVHAQLYRAVEYYDTNDGGIRVVNPRKILIEDPGLTFYDLEGPNSDTGTKYGYTQGYPAFVFTMPESPTVGAVDFVLTLNTLVDPEGTIVSGNAVDGIPAAFNQTFWKVRNGLTSKVHKQTAPNTYSTGGAIYVKVGEIGDPSSEVEVATTPEDNK
jgi:hypothetical protein